MQQAPTCNAHTIAVAVLSHSSELVPSDTDPRLPGRGVDFAFTRFCRSALAEWTERSGGRPHPDSRDAQANPRWARRGFIANC